MRITQTSQNFHGCKNVISDDIRSSDRMVTFISAQLNDEGKPDLSEYKKLKKMLDLPAEKINKDSISMIYTYIRGQKPNLFLDNQVLFFGDELKWIEEHHPKAMSADEYKKLKDVHLKAYTLLASITKRIMNGNIPPSDSGIKNVIHGFTAVMSRFLLNSDATYELLQHSFMSKIPKEDIAENFNKMISRTMEKFLR